MGGPIEIASDITCGLESAWNAGDGRAYAAYFTEDADLVNVFGMHFRGRQAIFELMTRILGTIFKGSATQQTWSRQSSSAQTSSSLTSLAR